MISTQDYFLYLQNGPEAASRLLLVSDRDTWCDLLAWYKSKANVLGISELIADDEYLPSMIDILDRLEERLAASAAPVLVNGLDPYLYLLAENKFKQAVYQLIRWLERPVEQETVFMARPVPRLKTEINLYSARHRLLASRRLLEFKPAGNEDLPDYRVELIENSLGSLFQQPVGVLKEWLRQNEKSVVADKVWHIAMPMSGTKLPGINPDINQRGDINVALARIYGRDVQHLTDDARQWLLKYACGANSLNEVAQKLLDKADVSSSIPALWLKADKLRRELLFWLLPLKTPPNSYLQAVLAQENINSVNFLEYYIITAYLQPNYNSAWAEERRLALVQAGIENFRAELELALVRSRNVTDEKIVPWLNCNTDVEKIDMLRRGMQNGHIPDIILENYHELAAYLHNNASFYGSLRLNDYFAGYRIQVVLNTIEPDLLAGTNITSADIQELSARNKILQKYALDSSYALLLVDGLGAAWLPMLVHLAEEQGMTVESMAVARASLPTITGCNAVQWPEERRLPELKGIDNRSHHGPEAHERSTAEETLVSLLELPGEICSRIRKALDKFEHVVLTGDHGVSRLAALALEKGYAKALKISSDPASLRHCRAETVGEKEGELVATLDGEYYCIRNYDYFPKSGNRGFAFHGGASLEEWLVPVIVFAASGTGYRAKQPKQAPQIIEDPDFDL